MAAKKILVPIDLNKNEIQRAVAHVLSSDPSSPVAGQFYYDSAANRFKYYDGSAFVSDSARSRHTGTQTASTISDFDTQVRTSRLDQMAQPTGSVNFNGQRLTNLGAASADSDAATLGQMKALVNGMDWKQSVVVASGTNVNISGPGSAIDGVTLSNGDRVLLYGQSTPSQNGPWVFNGSGSAMTRPDDWATGVASGGAVLPIEQGTDAEKLAICTTNGAITVNTTSVAFTIQGAGSTYTAGAGLSASGNTFNVGAGTGITVNADDVAIDTSVVARKATGLIGNGSATSIAFTHNLGNQWCTVQVYEVATLSQVECDIELTDANNVTLKFATAPTSNQFRVIVTG